MEYPDDNIAHDPSDEINILNVVEPTVPKLLDDTYYIFENPDKIEKRRLWDWDGAPFSSSRILLSSLPNCGKRSLILNIVKKINPPPSAIHIVHCDPFTSEYNEISDICPYFVYGPEDLPTADNIENPEISDEESDVEHSGPIVILDEITTEQLNKENQKRFERLVNYVATHKDCTIFISIQSIVNIPAKCRRAANIFALWRQNSEELNKIVASRCGLKSSELDAMFSLCKSKYDFIYIDTDEDITSPWRYRVNFISPISFSTIGDENKTENKTENNKIENKTDDKNITDVESDT